MATDDLIKPTAIMPTRPAPLAERYDLLARRFGDPLARLFVIANTSPFEEYRLRASAELLPYRYPKLRAQELSLAAGSQSPITINITLGPAPSAPPAEIDVTPPAGDPLA